MGAYHDVTMYTDVARTLIYYVLLCPIMIFLFFFSKIFNIRVTLTTVVSTYIKHRYKSFTDCIYEGQVYQERETFMGQRQRCSECVCQLGTVHCADKVCPPTNCQYPTPANPANNNCCPTCSNCAYAGWHMKNGMKTINPLNPCETCLCQQGNLTCSRDECHPVECSHPIQGLCCPECQDCQLEQEKYRNGQRFIHLSKKCQTCQCEVSIHRTSL